MDIIKVTTTDITKVLLNEFMVTVDSLDDENRVDLLAAIGEVQRKADNGEAEIWSDYLGVKIEIG